MSPCNILGRATVLISQAPRLICLRFPKLFSVHSRSSAPLVFFRLASQRSAESRFLPVYTHILALSLESCLSDFRYSHHFHLEGRHFSASCKLYRIHNQPNRIRHDDVRPHHFLAGEGDRAAVCDLPAKQRKTEPRELITLPNLTLANIVPGLLCLLLARVSKRFARSLGGTTCSRGFEGCACAHKYHFSGVLAQT